jgi:hypothetical protein
MPFAQEPTFSENDWYMRYTRPLRLGEDQIWRRGSVANFMQEVLKGQLPLSVRGLRGQGGELFGHGEALSNPIFKLPFSQHVHQFDADKGSLGRLNDLNPSMGRVMRLTARWSCSTITRPKMMRKSRVQA